MDYYRRPQTIKFSGQSFFDRRISGSGGWYRSSVWFYGTQPDGVFSNKDHFRNH